MNNLLEILPKSVWLVVVWGCSTTIHVRLPCDGPGEPKCRPTQATQPTEQSFVSVELHYPLSTASYELGPLLSGTIAENRGGDVLQYGLYRQHVDDADSNRHCRPIALSSDRASHLHLTVPLEARVTGPLMGCGGSNPAHHIVFNVEGDVDVGVDRAHWSPAVSKFAPHLRIVAGDCTAGGPDLAKWLSTLIEGADWSTFTRTLNGLSVRGQAENAWHILNQPIQLSEHPPSWLLLHPSAWNLSTPHFRDSDFVVGASLVAQPSIVVGEAPAITMPPMPPLGDAAPNTGFSVSLPIEVPFASMDDLAVGQTFDFGGHRLTISRAHVTNFGDRVAVAVALVGPNVDVEAVFNARPVIVNQHPYTGQGGRFLFFDNLDAVVDVNDPVLAFLGRHLMRRLRETLKQALVVPLSDRVEAARVKLDQQLHSLPIPHEQGAAVPGLGAVELVGTVSEAEVRPLVAIKSGAFVVWVKANGGLDLHARGVPKGRRLCPGWPGDPQSDGTF